MTDITTNQTSELPLPGWQKLLQDRGILGAALECGVKPTIMGLQPGWFYPVILPGGTHGEPRPGSKIFRWKATDSQANPKYLWMPEDPKDGQPWVLPEMYYAPGFIKAMQEEGVAIWASGEPDVWAWMSAGSRNVFCWFGEQRIPEDLPEKLRTIGVGTVYMYPDLDKTGMIAAAKVHRVLREAEMPHVINLLPFEHLGEGGDINKLWMLAEVDPDIFYTYVEACTIIPQKNTNVAHIREAHRIGSGLKETWEAVQGNIPYFWDLVIAGEETTPKDTQDTPQTREISMPGVPPAISTPISKNGGTEGPSNSILEKAWEWVVQDCGNPSWDKGERSKRFACRISTHAEDDKHPAAYLFDNGTMESRCYVCPKCEGGGSPTSLSIVEYLEKRGKSLKDFAPRRTAPPVQTEEKPVACTPKVFGGSKLKARSFLPMPYKTISALGGFCEMMERTKMTAVIGPSGGQKTTFLECMMMYWLINGYSGAIYGPEWSGDDMMRRMIQRLGGPSYIATGKDLAYAADVLSLPESEREAARIKAFSESKYPLSAEQAQLRDTLEKEIQEWPGRLYVLDPAPAFMGDGGVAAQFEGAQADMVSQGKRLDFIVGDYLQLMGNTYDEISQSLAWLKNFVMVQDVHGIVSSQMVKSDSRENRKGNNVGSESMAYANDAAFNSAYVLYRPTDENGDPTNKLKVRVTKNSVGRSWCNVFLHYDPSRLLVTDPPQPDPIQYEHETPVLEEVGK